MLHIRMVGTLGSGHLVQNSHEWLQEAERNHEQPRTLQTLRTRHNEKRWQKAESRTNKPRVYIPCFGFHQTASRGTAEEIHPRVKGALHTGGACKSSTTEVTADASGYGPSQ